MAALPAPVHRLALRVAFRGLRVYWRLLRPRTRGVCVAVWCGGRILLVRHSYKPGLGVPAGQLRAREEPRRAAARELAEEVGLHVAPEALEPAGHVVSTEHGNEDHLDFFALHLEREPQVRIDGREIVWAGLRAPADVRAEHLLEPVRRYLERPAPPAPASAGSSAGIDDTV